MNQQQSITIDVEYGLRHGISKCTVVRMESELKRVLQQRQSFYAEEKYQHMMNKLLHLPEKRLIDWHKKYYTRKHYKKLLCVLAR